jgi:small redox-active disulfide protein 2
MRIEILGTGCARCQLLARNVQAALDRMGTNAEVIKVEDLPQIMAYGVMSTPALVVDGRVMFAGRVPDPRDLERYLD